MSKRKPTPQQASCIEGLIAHRMLKIEACAGSGKTSTLTMMAEANPVPSLYWCFNKDNATEAAHKFPSHVKCSTTHSTAYSFYGKQMREKLSRPKGKYVNVAGTGSEIGKFFKISSVEVAGEIVLSQAYLGLLTRTTVAAFEQSADREIGIKHTPYYELAEKQKKHDFDIQWVQSQLVQYAKQLWNARTNLKSPVLATHDTYLKLWQLSNPIIKGFDILYVDEFQDTTPCVMDIVMRQTDHMKVVVVGDSRQAIYGWRGAVNALRSVDCETRELTKSFRYGQAVAEIATKVLEGKMNITGNETINSVVGMQTVDFSKPYTRLFRTNAALLSAAIEEIRRGTKVSIEIDVKDFIKLLQSAVALSRDDAKNVKHDKLLPYPTWEGLCEEADYDPELKRIVKVVASGDAGSWIDTLNFYSARKDFDTEPAHVTFTTAHKSKGREFGQVMIESDFKSCYNEDGEWVGLSEEEQNLLYVALTRAIYTLQYNSTVAEYLDRAQHVEFMADIKRGMNNFMRLEAAELGLDEFCH